MPTLRVNDLAPRVQYVADGAQTSFTVPFFFFEAADLQVRFDDGAEAGAHAVEGAGEAGGGTLLFDDPPPAGTRITIWREMALERGTEFQEAGAFRAATINDELDRLAMLAQELSSRLDRAPAFPASSTAAPVALAEPAAGKYLRWTADGLGLESVQPLEASAAAVTAFAETLLDDPDAAAARATLGVPAIVQNGTFSYAVAAGSADAIALAIEPPPAAYAAGQMFWFKAAATNAGPVTLAVAGLAAKAVQANGMALTAGCIRANDVCVVIYDGAQFQLVSTTPGGWQLIETLTASNSPALDFTKGIGPTFDLYKLVLTDVLPATDGVDLLVRVAHGGTFATGTGYGWHVGGGNSSSTAYNGDASGSGSGFQLNSGATIGNGASEGYSGRFFLHAPSTPTRHFAEAMGSYLDTAGVANGGFMGGFQNTMAAIDGLRVLFSVGNIASGAITLYGLRK